MQRWSRRKSKVNIDDFLLTDEKKIKWSSRLKQLVESGVYAEFNPARIRTSVYRPYCIQSLYFDSVLMHRRGRLAEFFPTAADGENTVTWVKVGTEWPSFAVASSKIPDLLPAGGSQCFPFYTYAEDGTNRRENITGWALEQFRSHYGDPFITKWDIFHYVYAVLHHPEYRQRDAAKLRRELPRIPFVGTSGAKAPVEGDADAAINGRSSTNADASINGNSSTEAQSSGNATVEERPFRAAHNDPIPALSSRAQPNDSRANHSAESRDPAPAGSGHKPGKEFSPQPPLGAARDQNSPARQAKGQAAARSFDSVAGRASAPGHSAQDDRVGRVRDADVFWEFVRAGRRLAEIHVHYEQQLEYPLTRTEKAGEKLDYRVERMKLSKDKTSLIYNRFLTLSGIPKETYEYRLGNRSALEWVIDQYQVSTDKRSGITNDPNRADDPTYILRLIGQVVTVSLETVKIVGQLPSTGIDAKLQNAEQLS